MSEKKEKLENNSLRRVLVESHLREEGFVMSSHHCHSFYEIYYVDRGNCRFMVENNIYDLRQGDFLLIPPDILHYTRYLDGPCKKYVIYFRNNDISPQAAAAMPGGSAFFQETRIFQRSPQTSAPPTARSCLPRDTSAPTTWSPSARPILRQPRASAPIT